MSTVRRQNQKLHFDFASSDKTVIMVTRTWFIHLVVAVALSAASNQQFVGHQLLKITPITEHQIQVLNHLQERPPSDLQHLDFWSEPSSFGETIYVRVNPFQVNKVKKILNKASISYDVIVDDIQRLLDEHKEKNIASRKRTELNIYDSYLTYEEITGGSNSNEAPRPKRAVWIDAGIHAREWISHATALYFIDRLAVDYTFDDQVRAFLDKYDFYIMPCVNPDGYQYSHDVNRLWRKTRSSVEGSNCRGTDANRNFDFFWGTSGSSTDPCSDIYRGPVAFSEPESRAVANFISNRNSTWEVFLTLHSYSQMWMAPFGYTRKKPTNYEALMTVANAAKTAIKRVYGTEYTVGSASEVLYRSSGTSRDWAAGVARIPYVYTVELRDVGSFGFLLPPDQILETGVETWEGVKAMMSTIQNIRDV